MKVWFVFLASLFIIGMICGFIFLATEIKLVGQIGIPFIGFPIIAGMITGLIFITKED